MTQEDKDLQTLLRSFAPAQSPELDFMARLQARMDTIDLVREQIALERRRNRRAVAVAVLCGVVVGALCALSLPLLMATIKPLLLFLAMAVLIISAVLGAYHLTRMLIPAKEALKISAFGGSVEKKLGQHAGSY